MQLLIRPDNKETCVRYTMWHIEESLGASTKEWQELHVQQAVLMTLFFQNRWDQPYIPAIDLADKLQNLTHSQEVEDAFREYVANNFE